MKNDDFYKATRSCILWHSTSHSGGIFLYYHLILTDDCNLCCSYCRAKAFDEGCPDGGPAFEIDKELPADVSYDLKTLYAFLKEDREATLTFYGGEPLLKMDLVKKIMDHAPARRFMVQTNGLLLDRLGPEYVNRFATILVSLDGPEALTDAHRGPGTYRKVMGNIKKIVKNGFCGELIARMTVTERTDIVDAVLHLSDNPYYSFSSIHWQLDANFSSDFSRRTFASWVNDRYNPGIRKLVRHWVSSMREHRAVPRWYPFLDTMGDLLCGRTSMLRCGAGHANYSIMTDGSIAPCPVMIGMKQYYVGHICRTKPRELPRIETGGECGACQIRNFCGGRCLYANIVQPWVEHERRFVCDSVKSLYSALAGALPEVRSLIEKGIVAPGNFSCEKYNGCEIIP